MTIQYRAGMLQGRLSNGAQSDHGTQVHAVVRKLVKSPMAGKVLDNGYVCPEKTERDVGLCGARPGRRSVGWSFSYNGEPEPTITCPRCLAKLGCQE